ncbi:MAG: HelD family protein [Christensenellaceae bacterium]
MQQEEKRERAHLEETKKIAQAQIADLQEALENAENSILFSKQEVLGETAHSIGNLANAESFEELIELAQYTTQISADIKTYETMQANVARLEKLLTAPYFARIDFTFAGEDAPTQIYIGRSSLLQQYEILIYDWRSPVASMFYRHTLGKASYIAPAGEIQGEISLKRQYEIKKGMLEYFFDADVEILDDYLRSMLGKNASPQMKSIVETIQREQDIVIRDARHDVLIVQGVAGSGKTSVALHRIAYLMYRGLTERLERQSIVILSPSNVFERYIANVLPELGEENVASFVLEELYEEILETAKIQSRFALLEILLEHKVDWAEVMQQSLVFKASTDFLKILEALPMAEKSQVGIREAYHALFYREGYLEELAEEQGVLLPENIAEIIAFTKENLKTSKLFFDDASVLVYLTLLHLGSDAYLQIRQVVVDEAQDYYPLQYAILRALFPGAKFTILGDVHQTIAKPEHMDFYETVTQVLGKRKNATVTLEKSFRATTEITQFAAHVLGEEILSFGRAGTPPKLIAQKERWDVAPLIQDAETALEKGYTSIGIVCKSAEEARRLYAILQHEIEVSLLGDAMGGKLEGIFVLPIYLAKGLEFDAAFLWGVDAIQYQRETDRALLFIGCTRALHELRLYYSGTPSPFLSFANKS